MDDNVKKYLSQIGRIGGRKSKRVLTSEQSKEMLLVREARRAYKKYYSQCFWSFDPNLIIQKNDVRWVAEQLLKNGNMKLWILGNKLCR